MKVLKKSNMFKLNMQDKRNKETILLFVIYVNFFSQYHSVKIDELLNVWTSLNDVSFLNLFQTVVTRLAPYYINLWFDSLLSYLCFLLLRL